MTDYKPEDYINYRINKARETINEVETLIKEKLWNTAINRMYYACYYAVGALLLKIGIKTSTHAGLRHSFGQHFINTGIIDKSLGKHYSVLFDKRQKGDYDDFIDFDENTTLELFEPSKQLIEKIEKLLEK
jgi:uncharacterized protein (UPF0332 family)